MAGRREETNPRLPHRGVTELGLDECAGEESVGITLFVLSRTDLDQVEVTARGGLRLEGKGQRRVKGARGNPLSRTNRTCVMGAEGPTGVSQIGGRRERENRVRDSEGIEV